jgi:hypothetical protein
MAEGAPRRTVDENPQAELIPILMVLKENDNAHPQAMQDAFIESYRRRNGPIEVHIFNDLPGERLDPSPAQPASQRVLELMLDFIQRHSQ